MANEWDWLDEREVQVKEEREKGYFNIKEGDNRFLLLSYIAPLAQVFDPATRKYRIAAEGDRDASIKGVCWVLQEGLIKEAKLPYLSVKAIRALQANPDWEFEIPFLHVLTLNAVGAGTNGVKYSLTASPKKTPIVPSILSELAKKPTPEQIVEKIKQRAQGPNSGVTEAAIEYPTEEIDPDSIPF